MKPNPIRQWIPLVLGMALLGPATPVVVAQEHASSRLSLSVGAMHLTHQDLIHTPFVHGGVSPLSLGVRYERAGRWMHFAEAGYAALASRLTEPYPILYGDHGHESPPHWYRLIDATYGLGRRLVPEENRSGTVGAAVRLDLQATDYNYGPEPNFGYFISPSLNLWYRQEIEVSPRQRLAGRAMAPLVSWVARSPYMVNDDQFVENIESGDPLRILLAFLADGEPAGWDRMQRLDLALDYRYALARRVEVGASYRFGFLRHSEPRPLALTRSGIELTTAIQF